MKVNAKDLDRVVQNALEYADDKAVRLHEVLFIFTADSLTVLSCDDYIAVKDSLEADLHPNEFALTIPDTEKLGVWIKKDRKVVKKADIDIRFKMTGIIFESDDDNIFLSYKSITKDAWELVMILLDPELEPVVFEDFAVRSERLVKLGKLRADKEAPIHIRPVDINGNLILQFKKGTTLIGAIRPVDLDYVQEEFLWHHTDQYLNYSSIQAALNSTD
jgi:hypothetical protein